ncbi:MAG TPA: protealysin inhibitor emfourin [Terriglobia bacterium]|nr:protealysin inhibitor emfourin [Terriglobia bacterium]
MSKAPACINIKQDSEPQGHSPGTERMRISFERSGGFAGIRLRRTIDSDTLSPEEARKLGEMIDAAHFFDLPPSVTSEKPGPDRFQYQLTIETKTRSHTVLVDEEAATKELHALLSYLTTLARRK